MGVPTRSERPHIAYGVIAGSAGGAVVLLASTVAFYAYRKRCAAAKVRARTIEVRIEVTDGSAWPPTAGHTPRTRACTASSHAACACVHGRHAQRGVLPQKWGAAGGTTPN